MKLDNKKIKSMCMMVDLGEFKREEIAKQFGISKSHLDKLYRLNNTGNNDTFEDKNILDEDEVRLINKTLMQENEELRNKVERLETELISYRSVSPQLPDNVQKFVDKCKTMQEIYAVKNIKYGNSFTKTYQEYGKAVLCIRLEDKLARAKQLLLHNVEGSQDESVIDTLIDLSAYSIMAVMELEKK